MSKQRRKFRNMIMGVATVFTAIAFYLGYHIVFAQKSTPVATTQQEDIEKETITETNIEIQTEVYGQSNAELSENKNSVMFSAENDSPTKLSFLYQEEDTETEKEIDSFNTTTELPSSAFLSVPEIYQNPELPTGCESVALTMLLMYEGFSLEKTTIADEFLVYHENNFAVGYVGDPYSNNGAGCFPPAIVKTANRFLDSQNSEKYAVDISESPFELLLSYIADEKPVAVWTTMYMQDPQFTGDSLTHNRITYEWYRLEHCVVLSGYDLERGIVWVNDPLEGIIERDLEAFEQLYNIVGQFAVVII